MRILAVLNLAECAACVLTASGLVAARVGGPVTALHVRSEDAEIPGEEIVPEAERRRRESAAATRSTALRAAFDAAALPRATWTELAGPTRASVAGLCQRADLVVLGRPPAQFYEDMHEALRAALLDAQAPVLLTGETAPSVLGAHIAVAWKPGEPAERAIAASLPLLRQATQVSVLIANDDGADGPLPDDLLDELDRAGVAHAVHVFRPDVAIGMALDREARSLGADLLVMGAFSHPRMLERVFGGATQDIIAAGLLPVLLCR
jgi:nucleotide-binding universal stress UspA family protein